MKHKIASITHLLRIPTPCLLCRTYHRGLFAVCEQCINCFSALGSACLSCATPLPETDFARCGTCGVKKPSIDRVITSYRFSEPLRTVIHEFKYNKGLYLSSLLGTLLMQSLPSFYKTECIIPMPMHPKRLHQRGFNQAFLLARYIASQLQRPLDITSCQKVINTAPQAELDAKKRRKNMHDVFRVSNMPPYQHVTLVDDLITTGSSANALAYELKRIGVKKVDLLCCAKTCL